MKRGEASRRARRGLLQGGLLVLLSVGIALAACEAALRLFHPRYALAAMPPPDARAHGEAGEMLRMPPGLAPVPLRDVSSNTYWRWHNPDTGVGHYVIHNNLGGRQSRDFALDGLQDTVNIAFFGDSMTQNIHMPVQYSFTEHLDYLLNEQAHAGDEHRLASARAAFQEPRFNVLNFGHYGWGPGREYLRWRNLLLKRQLAHVFYVAYENDLGDLLGAISAGMVRLDESGAVLGVGTVRTPAWKRFLSRWHLTYLGIDVWRRLAAGRSADDSAVAGLKPRPVGADSSRVNLRVVFRKLLRRWQREVAAAGGVFHVVRFPDPADGGFLREEADLLAEFNVLDLRHCFRAAIPGFNYRDWRFDNDPHWNAAANMVAATCFYRYLEQRLGLRRASDEALAVMRHDYYQAFLDSPVWDGERYAPPAPWARKPTASETGDRSAGEAIVAKYVALEVEPRIAEQWLEAVRSARAAGPVATSVWDVYVNLSDNLLVYVKKPCAPDWRLHDGHTGHFFLHVVPFTLENLSAHRAQFGFDNLDTGPFSTVRRSAGECVFSVPLPDYHAAMVTTGQFTERGDGDYDNLWSVRFKMPLAHSTWDVYASGRGLEYMKKPCEPADTRGRFFLRVYPLRSADLPANARDHVNWDFDWDGRGTLAEGTCRARAPLPDFPIAFVRTGQLRGRFPLLMASSWSVRIDFAEVERLRSQLDDGA